MGLTPSSLFKTKPVLLKTSPVIPMINSAISWTKNIFQKIHEYSKQIQWYLVLLQSYWWTYTVTFRRNPVIVKTNAVRFRANIFVFILTMVIFCKNTGTFRTNIVILKQTKDSKFMTNTVKIRKNTTIFATHSVVLRTYPQIRSYLVQIQ